MVQSGTSVPNSRPVKESTLYTFERNQKTEKEEIYNNINIGDILQKKSSFFFIFLLFLSEKIIIENGKNKTRNKETLANQKKEKKKKDKK